MAANHRSTEALADLIPLPTNTGKVYYVAADANAADGLPIPCDLIDGPFGTAAEAKALCESGQRVWSYQPEE